MLIGSYSHSLDVKGRVFVPAKFRQNLGNEYIVTRGIDKCIYVYSMEEWDKLNQLINTLPISKARDVKHYFFSIASTVEPDKQGRILLPSNLREFAEIDKEIIIAGMSDHVEIWSETNWDNKNNSLTPGYISEVMAELGI